MHAEGLRGNDDVVVTIKQSEKHFDRTKGCETKDSLPALSLSHDPQLVLLMVDALGKVPVVSDASDLGVVLELLLQLLAVVDGRLLSRGELRQRKKVAFGLQVVNVRLRPRVVVRFFSAITCEKYSVFP